MIGIKDIEYVLEVLRQAESDYRYAYDTVGQCDRETQDILHDLELKQHSYHENAELAGRLTEIRRKRRDAKDTVDELQYLMTWKEQEQRAISKLELTLGNMRKTDEQHRNRVYFRREGPNAGEMIGG